MLLQYFSKGTVESELRYQIILKKKDESFRSEDSLSWYILLRLQNTEKQLLTLIQKMIKAYFQIFSGLS